MNNIIRGIKNLIKWFPIIWKDRDWDQAYIEYMLQFKLEQMYKRFKDPYRTDVDWDYPSSKKSLKALKICITILERRRAEFYISLWDSNKEELTDELMYLIDNVERRDWKILHSLIHQYMEGWWD